MSSAIWLSTSLMFVVCNSDRVTLFSQAHSDWFLKSITLFSHYHRITVIVHVGCESLKNTCELVRLQCNRRDLRTLAGHVIDAAATGDNWCLFPRPLCRPSMLRKMGQLPLASCPQRFSNQLPSVMWSLLVRVNVLHKLFQALQLCVCFHAWSQQNSQPKFCI